MQPIDLNAQPGAYKVVFGHSQPEYKDLPALVYPEGTILTKWEFTQEERLAIFNGAPIELFVWAFGNPMQPLFLQVEGINSGD